MWFWAWLQLAKRIRKHWRSWQLSCRRGTDKRLRSGGDKLHLIHAGLRFLQGRDYQVWSFHQWWPLQIQPVRRRWWVLWPKFRKSQKHLLALQRQIGRAGNGSGWRGNSISPCGAKREGCIKKEIGYASNFADSGKFDICILYYTNLTCSCVPSSMLCCL